MKAKKDILSFFSGTPRPEQATLLKELQEKWQDADVFVLSAPTAFGKTLTIEAISRWVMGANPGNLKTSHIIVPNNVLLSQMEKSFRVFSLKSRSQYTCVTPDERGESTNCEAYHKETQGHCAGCPYTTSIRKAHGMPFSLSNYHTYMNHKLYKSVLLVDEAHLLVPFIKELEAKHIWLPVTLGRSLLPHYIRTYSQLDDYLAAHPELNGPKWDELRQELQGGRGRYLIERKEKLYHGNPKDCLSMLPIDTSNGTKSNIMFNPKKVSKIVLLSGTISRFDVEQLGLHGKRILFLEGKSPIPVERRPVSLSYFAPIVAKDYASLSNPLAKHIVSLVKDYEGKVLIHAPYSLAANLENYLKIHLGDRLLVHGRNNKSEVVTQFIEEPNPYVLLGSGLEEGIDLYGDDFRLQIICKVPFPNLGEAAWKYIAEERPERYAWESVKKIVQASGRICRGPQDFGKTIILDSNFNRVFKKYPEIFPNYFKEALNVKEI